MKRSLKRLAVMLILVLTACSPASSSDQSTPPPGPASNINPASTDNPAIIVTLFPNMANSSATTLTDQQGAVLVEVTPPDLSVRSDTLDFDVAMNTHSVDLSMDLASLAKLTTDTGITVQAITWDAPRGGHHLSGKLIFPAKIDNKSILQDAKRLTLTILNLDAPVRVFEWNLN